MCHRGFTEIYPYLLRNFPLPPLGYIFLFLALISVISFVAAQAVSAVTKFAMLSGTSIRKSNASASPTPASLSDVGQPNRE